MMNSFLGITVAQAIERLKKCEDEKAAAIDIGNFVCNHILVEQAPSINGLQDNDIGSAFDIMIAKLLSDIDINKSEGHSEGEFNQDDLVKISKAGNYVRYASHELIKGLKASHAGEKVDFEQIMIDAIDAKVEEDKVDPATEEEVDKIIAETDEIMDSVDSETDNPFYTSEDGSEDNGGVESVSSDAVNDSFQ